MPFATRWKQSPDTRANSSKERSTADHTLVFARIQASPVASCSIGNTKPAANCKADQRMSATVSGSSQ